MPKKFQGLNSKAAEAKAKKAEKIENDRIKKEKELEDAKWEDDDKSLQKKKERKEKEEKRKAEMLEKKLEKQRLLEEEETALKAKGSSKNPKASTKVTREEIRIRAEAEKEAKAKKEEAADTHLSQPLEENINRLTLEGAEARDIDQAISVLSANNEVEVDKHPEKRMKAAYDEFEKERLPQLKVENPNLRLSQLKQMLRKEWMKHPSNPLNKILAADYHNN